MLIVYWKKVKKMLFTKRLVLILILTLTLIIVLLPIITNMLMHYVPPKLIAPFGIDKSNIWIGFIATFYGAIIGGLVSGLFTYLGVRKTLINSDIQAQREFKEQNRAIVDIQEIYNVDLHLNNIKNKSGRLIITPEYKYALSLELTDHLFNFIELINASSSKIMNCHIKIMTKHIDDMDNHQVIVKIPIIFEKERVYIPTDKIKGENNKILCGEKYYIKKIVVNYETYAKENIKIIREQDSDDVSNLKPTIDRYYIKAPDEKEFSILYEIEGSENEWSFLKD